VTAPARILGLSAVAALALALAACGGGSKHASETTTTDANGCIPVSAPPAGARHETKPTARLSPSKTYDVTFKTNCGSFTIRLATKTSPATTASFAGLTGKGFFDHTVFHRIVPGFVIQGGDPTGTGTGGPGYSTVDTPPADAQYTHGVVAMAKTQDEAPGTAGSQFFIVTATDASLPPEYAIVGRVTEGLPVVDAIGQFGDPADPAGTATKVVVIEKATVTGT
jgi:cyclophilin family peptidyl-prolyl cis-trans isomerase